MTLPYKNVEEMVLASFDRGTIPRALRPSSFPSTVNYDYILKYRKNRFTAEATRRYESSGLQSASSESLEEGERSQLEDMLRPPKKKDFERYYGHEVDLYLNCLHFPVWPADAYGFCARLLDLSGWYAEFHPRPTRFVNPDKARAGSGIVAMKERLGAKAFDYVHQSVEDKDDRFGILGTDFIELRIAGAVWAMGGVFKTDPDFNLFALKTAKYQSSLKDGFGDLDTYKIDDERLRKYVENPPAENLYESVRRHLNSNYPESKDINWEELLNIVIRRYATDPQSPVSDFSGRENSVHIQCAKGDLSKKNACQKTFDTQVIPIAINAKIGNVFEVDGRPVNGRLLHPSAIVLEQFKHIASGVGRGGKWWDVDNQIKSTLLRCWAIDYLQVRWMKILTSQSELRRRQDPPPAHELPDWVRPAFRLMIAADEASIGLGMTRRESNRGTIGDTFVAKIHRHHMKVRRRAGLPHWDKGAVAADDSEVTKIKRFRPRVVQSMLAKSVAAVCPKARTPSVGCTISSFSLNLCLLPPEGQLNARLLNSGVGRFDHGTDESLNLLLIPYPYRIHTRAFIPSQPSVDGGSWASFGVDQSQWLGTSWFDRYMKSRSKNGDAVGKNAKEEESDREIFGIVTLVKMLLHETSVRVDGIILPELALDHSNLEALQKYLIKETGVKLVIAGVSNGTRKIRSVCLQSCGESNVEYFDQNEPLVRPEQLDEKEPKDDGVGNLVRTLYRPSVFHNTQLSDLTARWEVDYTRSKHHRWRLNQPQIERYGLAGRLDPSLSWWEDITIFPREVGLFELLPGSIASSLICEDLARIEPCQPALRAIGPNLICVLLMDGAQLDRRWPNQYAGVLADDPGSSVLTLTSFGLIRRDLAVAAARGQSAKKSRAIALWRDNSTDAQSLELPENAQALVITIRPEYAEEASLDGRKDGGNAARWRLRGVTPLSIVAESWAAKTLFSGFLEAEWDRERWFANASTEELQLKIQEIREYIEHLERNIAKVHKPKDQSN